MMESYYSEKTKLKARKNYCKNLEKKVDNIERRKFQLYIHEKWQQKSNIYFPLTIELK